MTSPAPLLPASVAALGDFKKFVKTCTACKPKQLWRQLCAQRAFLADLEGQVAAAIALECSTDLDALVQHLLVDATVPAALLALLHRLLLDASTNASHQGAPKTSSSPALPVTLTELSPAELSALSSLLGVLAAASRAFFFFLEGAAADNSPAAVALAAKALSSTQPFRTLSAALRPTAGATRQTEPPALAQTLASASTSALYLAAAAAACPAPHAAALCQELDATRLLSLACGMQEELLMWPGVVQAGFLWAGGASLSDLVVFNERPAAQLFRSDPAFGRLLLAMAAVGPVAAGPRPQPESVETSYLRLVTPLLFCSTAGFGAGPRSAVRRSAKNLGALARACSDMGGKCLCAGIAAAVPSFMAMSGFPAEQQRAFPSCVALAGLLADKLLETEPTSDERRSASWGASAAAGSYPGRLSTECEYVVKLVGVTLLLADPDNVETTMAADVLQTRVEWLLEKGLLAKCEALLRALARWREPFGRWACQLLTSVSMKVAAAALAGSSHQAPAVLAAAFGMMASVRKAMCVAALAPADDAGHAPGGASDACFTLVDELCLFLASRPQLSTRVTVLIRCAALQVLPQLMTSVAACLRRLPAMAPKIDRVLVCLTLLHSAGLADVTGAAGAPAILCGVLRALRRDGDACGFEHGPTLDSVTILLLTSPLTGRCWAAAAPELTEHLLELQVDLPSCLVDACSAALTQDASPSGDEAALAWHTCALKTAGLTSGKTRGGSRPLLGCWNRDCTNMEGASEAALCLKKCGGCLLARYCGEACQHRAWQAGHRAACLAWQQQQREEQQEEATRQRAEGAQGEGGGIVD